MSERECLIDFYNATDGRWWKTKWNWPSAETRYSKWYGITVDEGGHVKVINLRDNNLRGNIETLKRLNTLVNLQLMCLSTNIISGKIPECIGTLQSLQELDLSWNQLTGPIPNSLFTLQRLRILRLDHNKLEGSISQDLEYLDNLTHLNLSCNKFTGAVPKVAQHLVHLKMVDFSNNNFDDGPSPTLVRDFLIWSLVDIQPVSVSQSLDAISDNILISPTDTI